jgi:hypothetical protein
VIHAERAPGLFLALALAVTGCAAQLPLPALDQVDRMRASQGVTGSVELAPELYARAEQARLDAHRAHGAGDDVTATLRAERATAAYADAMASARTAQATLEVAAAQGALDGATARLQSLLSSRARLEADVADLEKIQQLAQQRLQTAPSRPSSPEREAARRVAVAALLTEARLLCGAARLVSESADGLGAAEKALASFNEPRRDGATVSTPIDAAGQCRVDCLDVLVRARRAAGDAITLADELFSELSAAGSWTPRMDERGVVVTLRDAYRGGQLTGEGARWLADLGQAAAAHPAFALQVVVHDAAAQSTETDVQKAKLAVKALTAAGANPAAIAYELAGARAPVADPTDPRWRARNERLEVVFVPK